MAVARARDIVSSDTQSLGFLPGLCYVVTSLSRILRSARSEVSAEPMSRARATMRSWRVRPWGGAAGWWSCPHGRPG